VTLAAHRQFEGTTPEATTEPGVRVEVWREDTTTMDAQRQKSSGGRRRRRKARAEPRANPEPILIAARRPNSPKLSDNGRRLVAASAAPARPASQKKAQAEAASSAKHQAAANQKRSARIVQITEGERDERDKLRLRLLQKLMLSEGRGAISRAAEEYRDNDFDFPEEQEVQLQLLEHFNEARARDAVAVLERLLQREPPIKRPVLDQRLRRLEEYADEPATRDSAAQLRRAIRT
jgi:hypothetical protein